MNYAVRMYRNVGFEIVNENDEEYIMICKCRFNKLKGTFTLTNFTTLPRVDFICPWEYFFQLSDLSYSSHDTKYSVRPKSQSSSSLH